MQFVPPHSVYSIATIISSEDALPQTRPSKDKEHAHTSKRQSITTRLLQRIMLNKSSMTSLWASYTKLLLDGNLMNLACHSPLLPGSNKLTQLSWTLGSWRTFKNPSTSNLVLMNVTNAATIDTLNGIVLRTSALIAKSQGIDYVSKVWNSTHSPMNRSQSLCVIINILTKTASKNSYLFLHVIRSYLMVLRSMHITWYMACSHAIYISYYAIPLFLIVLCSISRVWDAIASFLAYAYYCVIQTHMIYLDMDLAV